MENLENLYKKSQDLYICCATNQNGCKFKIELRQIEICLDVRQISLSFVYQIEIHILLFVRHIKIII
jgi:hypothetical protein